MSRRISDLNLSGIVPAGALGISLLLGSTAPCDASDHPTNPLPSGTGVRTAYRSPGGCIRTRLSDYQTGREDAVASLG